MSAEASIERPRKERTRCDPYEKKTLLEHILLRADTYVGSKEPETFSMYIPVADEATGNIYMQLKDITLVPAFFKIFDEILVNAADNRIRDAATDTIKVTIDADHNEISVYNNGKGIPIVKHVKENIYVPELIFGHLLTGSNYDDDEKKITGGRNGYGAKLANIYSNEFHVETHDAVEQKTYRQSWTNNMSVCHPPKITLARNKKDYTKITFKPDLARLNMQTIDADAQAALVKRVYDLTGSLGGMSGSASCITNAPSTTSASSMPSLPNTSSIPNMSSMLKAFINGQRIRISSFKDYVATYLPGVSKSDIAYERVSDRWEVAATLSDSGTFQQVSFVNNIATTKGGTHVNYVTDQIVHHLVEQLKKKNGSLSVKPAQIKNQLFIFINCLVENPSFQGQVKEFMTLRSSKFGSTCPLSDAFMKKIVKLGILETTLSMIHEKDVAQLKKTDGTKRSRLTGISKLHDANNAGTRKSSNCTLYIVEGESALTFALVGIPVLKNGNDFCGAYPLRGKLLNVREASTKQKLENQEITQLKQILGLQEGKTYTSVDSLRYGHICILTDSDHDGSHIKGLILNWLAAAFPSLLKLTNFVLDFRTPIVKCSKGREKLLFYTQQDYATWKGSTPDVNRWNIKYLKGLGSSVKDDIKNYFSAIDRHVKRFREIQDVDAEQLDLVFSKKRSADRKQWLKTYDKRSKILLEEPVISISEFIDKEFIQFSMYDNIRSIPSVIDGLKPGQRKILYTAFRTQQEIKVLQLAGKVAETTKYHHGEQSLCETITGMAQDFVGSNNVPLLVPEGQFGTRRKGGKDAAASRYIFTRLQGIARKLYHPDDDPVLTYLDEDGEAIEPEMYVPIVPMILLNGAEGIGTGYSTTVLNYHPRTIVQLLLEKTRNADFQFPETLTPWYKGFEGEVKPVENTGKWAFTGQIRRKNATTVDIVELPVHTWTANYKEFLEELVARNVIKDYKEYNTDARVHFSVQAPEATWDRLFSTGDIYREFKLITTKYTTNMHLFSPEGSLKHYSNVGEILNEFYAVRIAFYGKRKRDLLNRLRQEWIWASQRARFIQQVIAGELVLMRRSQSSVKSDLEKNGYPVKDSTYDYLLNMSLHTQTDERVRALKDHVDKLTARIKDIERTSLEDMYRKDLLAALDDLPE